jgi:hypothetical protein
VSMSWASRQPQSGTRRDPPRTCVAVLADKTLMSPSGEVMLVTTLWAARTRIGGPQALSS